jgi:hypothetical protein
MFEAFVLVCMLKDPTVCHALHDTEGPYTKQSQCVKRAYQIAIELPDWMPEYVATKYKCINKQNKIDINHDTEKEKG